MEKGQNRMRKSFYWMPLVVLVFLLAVANSRRETRPDGWYGVTDAACVQLEKEPFLTMDDCAGIGLERDAAGAAVIVMRLKPEGRAKLEKATAAAVGNPIAFVCGDSVIAMPVVREKISAAQMYVTHEDSGLLRRVYETLKGQEK